MRLSVLSMMIPLSLLAAETGSYTTCCGGLGSWQSESDAITKEANALTAMDQSPDFVTKGSEIGHFQISESMKAQHSQDSNASGKVFDPFDGYTTDY